MYLPVSSFLSIYTCVCRGRRFRHINVNLPVVYIINNSFQ